MLGGIRSRLTYANVMATVAVFIALGGGAYAVTKLDRNSVKSKHIVNGQVKPADVSGLVQGSGKVLANRFIMPNGDPQRTLLEIPGFGRLDAYCDFDDSFINFTNTTFGAIDFWWDVLGSAEHHVLPSLDGWNVVNSRAIEAATVALGFRRRPWRQKDGDRTRVHRSDRKWSVRGSGSGDAVD